MDTSIVFGICLGICFTLFVLFFVRDMLFKHYVNMIMSDIKVLPISNSDVEVQSIANSDVFINAVSSYVAVLESTLELFTSLLDSNVLAGDDRDIILCAKSSLENNIDSLNHLLQDINGAFKDAR